MCDSSFFCCNEESIDCIYFLCWGKIHAHKVKVRDSYSPETVADDVEFGVKNILNAGIIIESISANTVIQMITLRIKNKNKNYWEIPTVPVELFPLRGISVFIGIDLSPSENSGTGFSASISFMRS